MQVQTGSDLDSLHPSEAQCLLFVWSVFYASLSMGQEGEVEGGNRYMLTTRVVQCLVGP